RHVDDPAALAAPDHGATDQLRADERAGEVEVDDLLPLLEVEILGRHVEPAPAHVVDEDVDRPVLFERRAARAFRLERLADVGLDGGGPAAPPAHPRPPPRRAL